MASAIFSRAKRRCGTCRFYESSPLRDQGWCRNPDLRGSQERALVTIDEHRCARMLTDHWVPMPVRRRPVKQADAAPELTLGASARRAVDTSGSRWIYWGVGAAVLAVAALLLRLATSPTIPTTPTLVITPVATRPATVAPALVQAAPAIPTFVRVVGVGSAGVPLRARAAEAASGEVTLAEGSLLEVVGDELQAEGRTWRNLRDDQGRTGWVPSQNLQVKSPVAGEATAAFILRADAHSKARRLGEVPAAARLILVDSKAGEIVDASLASPGGAKWYWLKVVGTGETGWAYTGWVRRLD